MKVKDLIKFLSDFNPECEIDNTINPGWYCNDGAEPNGERDIEKEKLNATNLTLMWGIEGDMKEKPSDIKTDEISEEYFLPHLHKFSKKLNCFNDELNFFTLKQYFYCINDYNKRIENFKRAKEKVREHLHEKIQSEIKVHTNIIAYVDDIHVHENNYNVEIIISLKNIGRYFFNNHLEDLKTLGAASIRIEYHDEPNPSYLRLKFNDPDILF